MDKSIKLISKILILNKEYYFNNLFSLFRSNEELIRDHLSNSFTLLYLHNLNKIKYSIFFRKELIEVKFELDEEVLNLEDVCYIFCEFQQYLIERGVISVISIANIEFELDQIIPTNFKPMTYLHEDLKKPSILKVN